MVIVDSGIWIDYLAGTTNLHTIWLDSNMGQRDLGLTDLTLGEVLQGTRLDALFKQARRRFSLFPVFNTGGQDLAIASAQNYRLLRARGFTVRRTIDCIIATFCLSEGHTLLHRDRDFDPFEEHLGLQVVHPCAH